MIDGPIQVNNSGLVFYFDAKEPKSFIGKPTTNLLSNPTNEVIGTTSEFVQYADLAPIFNTYGTSVTYSLSLDLKAKKAGSVYVYMQNGSWTKYSFVGQSVNATTEYKRFTFNGLTAAISTPTETQAILAFYGGYGSGVIAAIKNVQVEISPAATPFVNGSRSNTQGLLDLTGGSTIDLTNTIYNTDSTIAFNGTSDITVNDNAILKLSGDKSFCMWINMASDSGGCGFGGKSNGTVNGMSLGYGWNGNGFMALCWNSSNSPFLAKDAARDIGKWVYLAAVQQGTTRYIYALDYLGTRTSSSSGGTHSWDNSLPLKIGRINDHTAMPSGSKIDLVMVYNRALSASEILKNFNSQRSRYSV